MSRYERPQDGRYREYAHSPPPRREPYYPRDRDMITMSPTRRPPPTISASSGTYDGPGDYVMIAGPRDKIHRAGDRDRDIRFKMTDREREILKQRMTIQPVVSTGQRHHRARSLSLSRSGSFSSLADSDSDSPEREVAYRRPGRDKDFYQDRDRRRHNSQSPPRKPPLVKYYHSSGATPVAAWSQPVSPVRDMRERLGDREYRVVEKPLHHSNSDPMRDLRFGMQKMGLATDMGPRIGRVIPARSTSIDGRILDAGIVARRPGSGARPITAPYRRPIKPQYTQVHVLILTWSFHDLKQGSYTAPQSADYTSLEEETRRVRETFESYGYKVREFLIPMQRSTESLRSKLNQFCRLAADDTLLIVYYHGHGCLDEDNELVFSSHEHPSDPAWSQNAAAELYAALVNGDSCPAHGRHNQYQNLVKKYERYRPISEVRWEEIRPTLLNAPSDLLLILDCCAAGGANLGHLNWQPPHSRPASPFHPPPHSHRQHAYTKHLFAACAFESTTSDDMTAAMCEVLDEWGPDLHSYGAGGIPTPFLTTKRLHQIMEEKLQRNSVGSQPIFKQLLPGDPEQYITLPNLLDRGVGAWGGGGGGGEGGHTRGDHEIGWR